MKRYFDAPDIAAVTHITNLPDSRRNKFTDIFDNKEYDQIIETDLAPQKYESPDTRFLREFESKHSSGSVLRCLCADRSLIKRGMTGQYHTKQCQYSRNELLAFAESQLRMYQSLFDEFNFDFVIGGGGNFISASTYHIAQQRNIPYVTVEKTRVNDQRILCEGIGDQSDILYNKQEKLLDRTEMSNSKRVQKFLRKVREGNPSYGSSQTVENSPSHIDGKSTSGFINRAKKIPRFIREYYSINYGSGPQGQTSRLMMKILPYIKPVKKKLRLSAVNFDELEESQSYVYFPLHAQPERSLMHWTRYFQHQTAVVHNIAQSLPVEMELYVKDHPVMKGVRSIDFFDKLRRLPHVRVLDYDTPNKRIFDGAGAVITVSSTVGLEALIHDVPVISLGDGCYSRINTVIHVDNYGEISRAVSEASESGVDMEAVSAYVAAAFEVGYHPGEPGYETKICNHIDKKLK
jgi:hypothetical protein